MDLRKWMIIPLVLSLALLVSVYVGLDVRTLTSSSVSVMNNAPMIENLSDSIFACENSYLSYFFNVTNLNEVALNSYIYPQGPFYVFPSTFPAGSNVSQFEITSGILTKLDAGGLNAGHKTYQENVSVSNGVYSDSKRTNITVIEVNNPPSMQNIGVQTVYVSGANSTFYKQVMASDLEDGNSSSGNLNFSIAFSPANPLFNISSKGIMNFTPNLSQVGVYNVSVCVKDRGLLNPYPNMGLICGQNGSSITVCENFSLTVTNSNRPPTIVSYYPPNLTFSALGTDTLKFNVSTYDPDGTIPDVYWYVNGTQEGYSTGSSASSFEYNFGCVASGLQNVEVAATDGLANDSLRWNISVDSSKCSIANIVLGGGGGGTSCSNKWVCKDWATCQNAQKSLEGGILNKDDYRTVESGCSNQSLNQSSCGFQLRYCLDLSNCSGTSNAPPRLQSCIYTENPSCADGIKNCHDGSCETLVDCGGPCQSCATCSDGIKNQRETGIDCGGPCQSCAPSQIGSGVVNEKLRNIALIILVIILAIIALRKLYNLASAWKSLNRLG